MSLSGNRSGADEVVADVSRAVQFDGYGDIDVLEVREVPRPEPSDGQVLVEVKTAGINPGEAMIRRGLLDDRWPATFPSGQGSDFAGVVTGVGAGVSDVAVGDEVIGFSELRSSHAEYVVVPADQLTHKPAAGASGGVGAIAVQLAKRSGATVLGIAGPANDEWLRSHGVIPVNYGDGLAARLGAASPTGRVDAFLDLHGNGYVKIAVEQLGVSPDRVDTIIDFAAVEQFGVKFEGTGDAATVAVLAELADLIAEGALEVPIAGVYPLADVREAYRALEERHTRGKLILSVS